VYNDSRKTFKGGCKMSNVKSNYMIAKAQYDAVVQTKEDGQEKVLKENVFYTPDGRRATNDFMMIDVNEKDYIKFLKLCYPEYKKAGLNPKDYNDPIDWKYHEKLIKAENELIAWGKSKIINYPQYKINAKDLEKLSEKIKYNFKYRDKVIDLTLRLSA